MKLGVLAVVASLGGLFVLSKTENKASENVVFHARPWKKKRLSNEPTQLPLWEKIYKDINFPSWRNKFVDKLEWREYNTANQIALKPKWGIIDRNTGLLDRSIRYAAFNYHSPSLYNLLNPFILYKFFQEWNITDKDIISFDTIPNNTSTLDELIAWLENSESTESKAFHKAYERVKDSIPLPPRFTKKTMKQFVESFGGSTKAIELLKAFENGDIKNSSLGLGGANGDWYWLRWAQKNLYEMDNKAVLTIIFEIAAIPETSSFLNGKFGNFYDNSQWCSEQSRPLDPKWVAADNYRAPYKTITQLSLITQILSGMALIKELPMEAKVLQQNVRSAWDVYVEDPYLQRYDRKIHLEPNRDVWDMNVITEIWKSIALKIENEVMFNSRMSKKAGRRKEIRENEKEVAALENILDGGANDERFLTENPYRYLYEKIKLEMPDRLRHNFGYQLERSAQKFPMVATKTRLDKLKQQGIDEIDKRMQEALDKIPEVEGVIRDKAQKVKDEWNAIF